MHLVSCAVIYLALGGEEMPPLMCLSYMQCKCVTLAWTFGGRPVDDSCHWQRMTR